MGETLVFEESKRQRSKFLRSGQCAEDSNKIPSKVGLLGNPHEEPDDCPTRWNVGTLPEENEQLRTRRPPQDFASAADVEEGQSSSNNASSYSTPTLQILREAEQHAAQASASWHVGPCRHGRQKADPSRSCLKASKRRPLGASVFAGIDSVPRSAQNNHSKRCNLRTARLTSWRQFRCVQLDQLSMGLLVVDERAYTPPDHSIS